MRTVIASIEGEFCRYQTLGEGALRQLTAVELARRSADTDNSIATIVWHIAGNLRSRFTDFLTTDGEKPWRNRDAEFEHRTPSESEILAFWNEGWGVLLATLAELVDADLERHVVIRGQALPVVDAVHRALAHIAYHVGQIVYVAKGLKGGDWTYLSIPPGQSAAYNQKPSLDKPPGR